MKKTKIICTLGPTTDNKDLLVKMLKAGMDLARFNFSHGSYPECEKRLALLDEASKEAGKIVGRVADTKGPEMRLGLFKGDKVELKEGAEFTLTTELVEGTAQRAHVNYDGLHKDVKSGDPILLDDGKLSLEVKNVVGNDIHTLVVHGGVISSRKRVATPGVPLNLPFMSEQDKSDITFAAKHNMDYVAASFVRNADDAIQIRKLLESVGSHMGIVAKIENRQGVDNIDAILKAVDGIMVARGDLGVEIPAEEVPIVQKQIIAKCNALGKPVITATQMLDSMINNYRCTRAEASDVANSIFDGTDAIMLSGETASGSYPLEAVQTMARIAERTEEALDYANIFRKKGIGDGVTLTESISHATVQISQELEADAIMPITESGYTARLIAKYRPKAEVIAVSPKESTLRRMTLYWSIKPLLGEDCKGTDEMIESSIKRALAKGVVQEGESVVVSAGMNVGKVGSTNLIKVITVGTKLLKGLGIGKKAASGKVCKIVNKNDLSKFQPGDIMVVASLENEMGVTASKAAAIVAEEGGFTSPAAIVGINCGIPVMVGVGKAMSTLKDGDMVTVDVATGSIYSGVMNVK